MAWEDVGAAGGGFAGGGEAEDEFGVAEDGDVGVVGGKDELAALLFFAHSGDDALGDEAVVEVVLWLVHDQWGA